MASAVALETFEVPLIDSHCHIVFRNFDDDLEEVAQRWRDAGVGRLLHACVEPSEIPAIRALADRFPELRYSVGVHPLDTEHWTGATPAVLRQAALDDPRVLPPLPGLRVAAKTGTAQKLTEKGMINFAWLIAFAPVDQPRIALAIAIEGDTPGEETGGGRYASPVAHAILQAWLEGGAQGGGGIRVPLKPSE